MANYQIVERPHLYPRRTVFTGDPREIPVIDTGVNDVENGRLYVSMREAEDLAKLVGFVSKEEAEALRAENAALKAQLAHLPEVIERTINAIRDAASTAVADLATDPDGASDPVPAAEPVGEAGSGKAARKDAALAREQGRPRL